MRNVGDVNAKLKSAVGQYFDVDRIVEIAGRFRIDRNRVAFPEIVAADEIFLG